MCYSITYFYKTKYNINYNDLYNQVINNQEMLLESLEEPFEKHSKLTLKLNFYMLGIFSKKIDIVEFIDILAEVNNDEEFEQVQCLKAIINLIDNNYFEELDSDIQNIFLQYALGLKNHNNQDIRYFTIKALIKMIIPKNKKWILTQLSKSMDYDNVYIKNLILSNFYFLWELDKDIKSLLSKKKCL